MEKIEKVYITKFDRKVRQSNHSQSLPAYFAPMIGDKKEVKIAELGAGIVNTIGDTWEGVKVEVYPSDILAREYAELWQEKEQTPILPVDYEDMENLSYEDESFDIVHCVNALDHTENPQKAIEEMKRICKKGGWIYMRHAPSCKKRFGRNHFWNFEEIELPEFKTHIEDGLIVAIYKK